MMAAVLLAAGEARAQAAWDSPMLLPPGAPGGVGLFLDDPAGARLGVMGTWRSPTAGFGLRLGIADRGRFVSGVTVYGGADFNGRLVRASTDFPLDMDWVLGAGLGIANNVLVSFPLGISIGRAIEADGVRFTPYVTPRVVLDGIFGGNIDSELDLALAVDLGVDLAFQPGWAIRFGGTIGDREAISIGIAF